eukprot:3367807-Prymnesium_polylepis.2
MASSSVWPVATHLVTHELDHRREELEDGVGLRRRDAKDLVEQLLRLLRLGLARQPHVPQLALRAGGKRGEGDARVRPDEARLLERRLLRAVSRPAAQHLPQLVDARVAPLAEQLVELRHVDALRAAAPVALRERCGRTGGDKQTE